MTWATEMRNLVSDIKASTGDRLQFVKDNQKDTHDLLSRFDQELKTMAADVKDLLAKSERARMADFKVMIKDIQSRIDSIQEYVAGLLGDYVGERKEAHANWGVLRKRERVIMEEKVKEPEKEAKKSRKHHKAK